MSEERLIKKYPNRRLYDSQESCYITVSEVRDFVVKEIPFKVVDNKSGEDITRSILLQIIMEQESDDEPLFSVDVLSQFIRNSGVKSQEGFVTFLEQGLDLFKTQQAIAKEQMSTAIGTNPLESWLEIGQKNMKIWSDMQKDLLKK